MFDFPIEFSEIMIRFQNLFSKPVFAHAKVLVAGAILTPGKRTVTSALRIMGLSQEKNFPKYHRVLSLSKWSTRKAAIFLLKQLLKGFLPDGPVVLGIDETLERRWGRKITARGIYRDNVRSSHSYFVKSSGLRWISLMLLVPVGWAKRIWALPFLTVLAPSERYAQQQGRQHKKLTDWARQMLLQVKRWLPDRQIVVVGDSSYSVIELLDAVRKQVTMITRLRMDAALYTPVPPRIPGKPGRNRKKGKRLPTLKQYLSNTSLEWQTATVSQWYGKKQKLVEIATATAVWYHSGKPSVPICWVLIRDPESKFDPVALLCTDQQLSAEQIVTYFVRRWAIEVTFQEVRAHLGVETQRQWSEKAISRTTPVLLGLFSIVTLLADNLYKQKRLYFSTAAWYKKQQPTFSDAIASVRQYLWQESDFCMSRKKEDMIKIPVSLLRRWQYTIAWAA